jgi:hypothetical protein
MSEGSPADATCYVCLEGKDAGELIRGCACRGSAGFGHLVCLVESAKADASFHRWRTCSTCKQYFTGDVQLGLAEAHWEIVRGLPAEHQDRLFAMGELARARQECSCDYEAALPLFEECLAVERRVRGDEHQSTLTTIASLANLHQVMGNLKQALALGTEGLAIERRTLGNEHPNTLRSINNLAGMHHEARNPVLSLPLLDEALGAQRRTLGNQHVDTLSAIQNLAAVYVQVGWAAEAVPLLREAAVGFRRVLGEEHLETHRVMETLRVLEAEMLEARQTMGKSSALEAKHPATKSSTNRTRKGAQARVVGIQSRPELNGRVVRVGKLTEATGRFRVIMPASEVAMGGHAIFMRSCVNLCQVRVSNSHTKQNKTKGLVVGCT